MSFKDLAKIEGYDLDAMKAKLSIAKERIAELEAEIKKQEEDQTARCAGYIAELEKVAHIRNVLEARNVELEKAIREMNLRKIALEGENQQLKKQDEEWKSLLQTINNGVTIP